MDSGSDQRVTNNVMRHEYRALSENELQFHQLCDSMGQSRELSLAKTKIEEAVMWAVKHLTK